MAEHTSLDWASAARIALVVPGDSQVDDEFWRLLTPYAIPLVSRTTGAAHAQMADPASAAEHTRALAESSDIEVAADRLRAVKACAAAYVDTSISFIRGPGGDVDISRRIEHFLGVPTVSTSTAVVDACRALGIAKLGVLTVYVDAINEAMPAFFGPQGIEVARMRKASSSMEAGNTAEHLGQMSPGELIELGQSVGGDGVDAVFIPCTAVRTLDAIEALEAVIDKPVITAIQATMWRVSRLARVSHDAALGGKLFEIT